MKNYGYQNELDFVILFNEKHLNELDKNSQSFLKDLFGEIIDSTERIICWKNKANQKSDIFIKYRNYVKGISIKYGNSDYVHAEGLQDFKLYLINLHIPYKLIDKYIDYHYGYVKDENGVKDYTTHLNSYEYKEIYQEEIDSFNSYVNKTRIIVDMIDRFIIKGKNSNYEIDAIIHGSVDNYVWILKYDIYDLILSNRRLDLTSPHIACLTIAPKQRIIKEDSKLNHDRHIVMIHWAYMKEAIIKYKKNML